MIFSKQVLQIKEANRQFAIRISNTNPLNMFFLSDWDFTARSVFEPNEKGFYGILLHRYILGYDWFFRLLLSSSPDLNDIRVILLEIDSREIILEKIDEIAISRANIYQTFTIEEFKTFAREFKHLNYEIVSATIEICSKAGYYFRQNDFDSWLKYTVSSFEQMQAIRESNSQPVIKPAQNEYREMFEPTYKALKKLHEIREGIRQSII